MPASLRAASLHGFLGLVGTDPGAGTIAVWICVILLVGGVVLWVATLLMLRGGSGGSGGREGGTGAPRRSSRSGAG